MKKIYFIILIVLLTGCRRYTTSSFYVKNDTSDQVELILLNSLYYYGDSDDKINNVIILPGEEKLIKIIGTPMRMTEHNCYQKHGIYYFEELVFDTYLNGVKIDKQLWQKDLWKHERVSEWKADYRLSITNDLCK